MENSRETIGSIAETIGSNGIFLIKYRKIFKKLIAEINLICYYQRVVILLTIFKK